MSVTKPDESVDTLANHFQFNLWGYNIADALQKRLPPGWGFSIVFREGNYGNYHVLDEAGKNVRIGKIERNNMPMAIDLAWKVYQQREREMVVGGGGSVDGRD